MKKPQDEPDGGLVQRFGPGRAPARDRDVRGHRVYLFAGAAFTWLYGALVLAIASYVATQRAED